MISWNSSHYLRYSSSRLKPAIDLLSTTLSNTSSSSSSLVRKVLDLGCGPGNITPFLSQAFPEAKIIGIDSSNNMIEAAKKANQNLINSSFILDDINNLDNWSFEEPFDVVYSNATLHWIPDQTIHRTILLKLLKPNGGILAVQMPDTRFQPSHVLMDVAVNNCGYRHLITESSRIPRVEHDPSYYYSLLSPHTESLDFWSTEYIHELSYDKEMKLHPVAEFTSATGLQPILRSIEGNDGEVGKERVDNFMREYNRLLYESYPPQKVIVNGSGNQHEKEIILFPFKRFFFVAKR